MLIDAHQHFWNYSPAEYPWIDAPRAPLRRDFLPTDLAGLLAQCHLQGSVAVQARQSLAESRWLLDLADRSPFIRGVVGWVDLQADNVAEQLAPLAQHPRFVGVRHVAQDEPDDRFLVRPAVVDGIRQLLPWRLVYDILIYPTQLPAAIELVRLLPDQVFILDHLAKPLIRDRQLEPWATLLHELARCPNVACKVSGLVTEADWQAWQPDDFRSYWDIALQAFGPERLMFGSDWPVCLTAGSYNQVFQLVEQFLVPLSPAERAHLLGGTATRWYRLQ